MGKHGFENVGIEEIRQELKDLGVDDLDILNQSKLPLVQLLLEKRTIAKEKAEGDDLHEEVEIIGIPENLSDVIEEDDDNLSLDNNEEDELEDIPEVRPSFGSDKWNDYVMSQFTTDEIEGGNPKCVGLRRIVQELLGPIISVTLPRNTPPEKSNQGTATVVVGMTIRVTKDESHPAYNEEIYVEDIADCSVLNTPEPYNQHQSATAQTKAEARILRKVLELVRVIAAEESGRKDIDIDEAWNPSEPITDEQINVIDMLGGRANVDIMSYINAGSASYRKIEEVSRQKAKKMIDHLNRVVRGKCDKPKGSGTYNSSWRN
jgi:hypothetical protein